MESVGLSRETRATVLGLTADPTSHELTLQDLAREPKIYLIPECETSKDVAEVLEELCEEDFHEPVGRLVYG